MQLQQPHLSRQTPNRPDAIDWHTLGRTVLIAALAAPALAMAQTTGDASTAICGLLQTVEKVLTGVSVVVVTIALIFAGYQIAFAHKRITEVAPILIGGILIGAAGQIASTLLSNWSGTSSSCSATSSITPDVVLTQVASIAHSLAGYLV
jgi:type IV secretion system protein VirB2